MDSWVPASVGGAGSSAPPKRGTPVLEIGELLLSMIALVVSVASHCGASECDFLVVNALTAFVSTSALLLRRYQAGAPPYDRLTKLRVFALLSLLSFAGGVAGAASDHSAADLRAAVAFTFLLLLCLLLSTAAAYHKWQKQVEVRKAWGGASGSGFGSGFNDGGAAAVGPPMPYNVDDASSGGGAMGGDGGADDESFSYTAM
jgi:uncharacterized membrane protein YfcA